MSETTDSYVECGLCEHRTLFSEHPDPASNELSVIEALWITEHAVHSYEAFDDPNEQCEAVDSNGEQVVHLANGDEYLVRIRRRDDN